MDSLPAAVVDKKNLIEQLGLARPVEIEIGCGNRKRNERSIGIDMIDYPNVDIVGSLDDVLSRFPDCSVSRVDAHHVLEHLPNVGGIFAELRRVCCDGAEIHISVPHFCNSYYYSDPTHKTPFGLYSLNYYAEFDGFQRKVPTYARVPGLKILHIEFGFKSSKPWYVRHALRKMCGMIANYNTYTKEFWEENLVSFVSPYEVVATLTVRQP